MRDRNITIRDMGAFPVHHPRTAAGAVTAAVLLAALAAPASAGADPADAGEFQVRVGVEGSSLRVGQTADYTVKAVNTGPADYPDAAIVQLLPPDLDRPEAADGGQVEPLQIVWERPLESGGEAVVGSSGRVGSPSEGFDKLTTVACVRPSPGAGLVGCTSSAVPITASLTPLWAGGAVLVLAAAGAWYLVRRRPEELARIRATAVQFSRSAGAAVGIRRVAAQQGAAAEKAGGAADGTAPAEAPAEVEEMLDLELMPWRYRFDHLAAPAAAAEPEAGAEGTAEAAAEESAEDAAGAEAGPDADGRERADEVAGAPAAAENGEGAAEPAAAATGSEDEPVPAGAGQDAEAAAEVQDAADAGDRDTAEEPEPASAEQGSAAGADPEAGAAAESAAAADTGEPAADDGDGDGDSDSDGDRDSEDAGSDPATTPADRALAAADRD